MTHHHLGKNVIHPLYVYMYYKHFYYNEYVVKYKCYENCVSLHLIIYYEDDEKVIRVGLGLLYLQQCVREQMKMLASDKEGAIKILILLIKKVYIPIIIWR